MLNSLEAKLVRTGDVYQHRNGLVEPIYFDIEGSWARYRISADSSD